MIPGLAPASIPFWKRPVLIPRPHPRDALAAFGLVALTLALFHAITFKGRVLYERDICLVWYPQVAALKRAFLAGSWPVWDNSIAFGQPLWADPSAQVLYPFTWLHLVFPPWTYYTFFVLSHVVFSALGTYALARRFEVSRGGAFVAAALWMTSGPFLSLVNLWHHFAGACWIPWVFLAADIALRSPRILNTLAWGAVLAAQILAGSADACAMAGILVAAHGLRYVDWRRLRGPANRRLALSAAFAVTLALAVTAALWLPALDLVSRSARSNLPAETRLHWSVHPLSLVQTVLPILWDEVPLREEYRQAFFEGREPFLRSLYLGMPALALVAAAFSVPHRRYRWLFALVLITAGLVSLGRHSPAYTLAVHLLPPLKILRYPVKAAIPMAFAFAVLAGMGFDVWSRRSDIPRQRFQGLVMGTLIAATALGAAAFFTARFRVEAWGAALATPAEAGAPLVTLLARTAGRVELTTLLASATLILALVRGVGTQARSTALAAALLSMLDLLWAHGRLNQTAPLAFIKYRPPVLDALHRQDHSRLYVREYVLHQPGDGGPARPFDVRSDILGGDVNTLSLANFLGLMTYLSPPQAGRWGLEGSYDRDVRGLYPRPLAQLTRLLRQVDLTPHYLPLLEMGAVGHVVSLQEEGLDGLIPTAVLPSLYYEPIRVFRVPNPLPRTYAVGGARVAEGNAAFQLLQDQSFDRRSEVILAEGSPSRRAAFSGTSRIARFQPDRVRLEANLAQPGYVVLVDAYDPGWRATLDGRDVPVLRANLAFRAVQVPPGHHVIEYVYRPPTLIAGLAISGIAVLAAAAGAVIGLRRSRG